jgi:hypothetical protein
MFTTIAQLLTKWFTAIKSIFVTVEHDVFADFDRVKRESTMAAADVARARHALEASIRRAAETAEAARTAAETASNAAAANAARLALEARAAAESVAQHRGLIAAGSSVSTVDSSVTTTDSHSPY